MRFRAPAPITNGPTNAALTQASREERKSRGVLEGDSHCHRVAAPWSLKWRRLCSDALATEALIFNGGPNPRADSIVYVCVERHKYKGMLTPWRVTSDRRIEIMSPVNFQSSLDIFADHVPNSPACKDVKVHIAMIVFDCESLTQASIHRGKLAFTMSPIKTRQRKEPAPDQPQQSAMDIINTDAPIDDVDHSTLCDVVRTLLLRILTRGWRRFFQIINTSCSYSF